MTALRRSLPVVKFVVGIALLVAAAVVPAAAVPPVPEVGPGEIGSAVTLLAGGYMIFSAKFRNRK
jgi:hypothetical protein